MFSNCSENVTEPVSGPEDMSTLVATSELWRASTGAVTDSCSHAGVRCGVGGHTGVGGASGRCAFVLDLGRRLTSKALWSGSGRKALRFAPPLVFSESELRFAADVSLPALRSRELSSPERLRHGVLMGLSTVEPLSILGSLSVAFATSSSSSSSSLPPAPRLK
jgi:hypothetical protein